MKVTAFGGIGICQKGCLRKMDKQNNYNSSKELRLEFERIIKDLSADEIKKVMSFVSTLKVQHTQSPCVNHHRKGRK